MKGRLITVEGIDGVGKTTHVGLLTEYLRQRGVSVTTYRDPGTTLLGERLRELIKIGTAQSPLAELLLFATSRAELVVTRVVPDLESGHYVVLDRFTDSTLAYQGALDAIPEESLTAVCKAAAGGLVPDVTFWLDLEPGAALGRRYPLAEALAVDGSAAAGEPYDLDAIEKREAGYFARVHERYAAILRDDPQRVVRIDASGAIEETALLIQQALDERMVWWERE